MDMQASIDMHLTSTIVLTPGVIFPALSASNIMAAPILSLTDEHGFIDSSLAKMLAWPSLTRRIGIMGVFPIKSRGSSVTDLCFFEVNKPIL